MIRQSTLELMSNLLNHIKPDLVKCELESVKLKPAEDENRWSPANFLQRDARFIDYIKITRSNGANYMVNITMDSEAKAVANVFLMMRAK